jgi:hypothetical protein
MPDTTWVISVRRPRFAVVPAPGIGVGDEDAPPLPALPLAVLLFPALTAGTLSAATAVELPKTAWDLVLLLTIFGPF